MTAETRDFRKNRRRLLATVGSGVTACALLAQGAALATDAGTPGAPTTPVHATKADLAPGRMYSSPAFAVDPNNPMRIVAGVADLNSRRCHLLRSTDGASTWSLMESSPSPASFPFCAQSQGGVIQAPVAFGRNGDLYMALGGWDESDAARTGGAILVARSSNMGDSWETTEVYSTRGKTGEAAENVRPVHTLAVDTKTGRADHVYVTFGVAYPGFTAPNQRPNSPMVAVSRDGGRTFDAPLNLAGDAFQPQAIRDQAFSAVTTTTAAPNAATTTTTAPAAGSRAATPNQAANFGGNSGRNHIQARVDGKGTVYVAWLSGTASVSPSPPSAQMLSKSTDGGRTWETSVAIPFSYENAAPRMAVSPEGVIHLVYGRNPDSSMSGGGEIYHRASTDGGATWSEPQNLTDDPPAALYGQYFPNVSVAPNGRVDVVWWDTRDDVGIRSNDVYYTYSADDGRTWSRNVRITDRSVDRRYGVWGVNYDINSPPGVGSANEFAIFGWDDTRNTDVTNPDYSTGFGAGTQDLFTSVVQFAAVGGGASSTAKVLLAATAGLVLVGLVLLIVAMSSRRSGGGPAPKKATTGKEAAKV